jgi:hypothetical protein
VAVMVAFTAAPALALLGSHGVFDGGYGIDVPDLMQYMAFIRQAGEHGLIANPFDVVPSPHVFLDPVFELSGLLWRLGASIQLALLAWVPVAAVLLWLGFRAYARRFLDGGGWAVAFVLALVFLTPATALADWLHATPVMRFGSEVIGLELLGGAYPWSGGQAVAVALLPLCLLLSERAVGRPRGRPGELAGLGLLGALVSWIHPWQGLILLLIWLALAGWGRLARRYLRLLPAALLTAAPLVYFEVLARISSAWRLVSGGSGYSHFGLWLLVSLIPLVLALPGLRGTPARDDGERMLRLWPLAATAVYLALSTSWFYHAFIGLSLPAGILTVRGWRHLATRRSPPVVAATAALAAALLVPGLIWLGRQLVLTRPQLFFRPGEARALAFLERLPRPGAVLAPTMPLGQAVPAFTGRATYTGHPTWTPAYAARTRVTSLLFDGRLAPAQARELIALSRAAFLLSDCQPGRVSLTPLLGGRLQRTWHFGCATLYELRPGGRQAQSVAPSASRLTTSARKPARSSSASTSASASPAGA